MMACDLRRFILEAFPLPYQSFIIIITIINVKKLPVWIEC